MRGRRGQPGRESDVNSPLIRYLASFVILAFVVIVAVAYSRHKVDSFCASISLGTSQSDLPNQARQADLGYGVVGGREPGVEFVGIARGHFTGDYSCVIDFNNGHVIGTRIFSD